MKRTDIYVVILLSLLAVATIIPFCYKAVYCPVKLVSGLTDTSVRRGDFWYNFPGSFADKYNPALRERTGSVYSSSSPGWGYGPIQNLVTLPLTYIKSIKDISIIWLIFNYAALALSLWLVLKMLKDTPFYIKLIIIFLWVGFWPIYLAIQEDVIEIFELFLVILSLFLLYKKRDILSGVSLGIAAMAKFLPLIFFVYLLIKGRMKAALAMFITVLVIAVGTQFTLGWQNSGTLKLLLLEVKEKSYNYMTYYRSQSISSAVQRIFSARDYSVAGFQSSKPQFVSVVKPLSNGIVLAAAFFLFYILYKRRYSQDLFTEYGLLSLAMILLPSHGQPYYLIFCLIGFTAAARFIFNKDYNFPAALFAIAYLLTGYINQIQQIDLLLLSKYNVDRYTLFYALSFPAYGAILLFISLAIIYGKEGGKRWRT